MNFRCYAIYMSLIACALLFCNSPSVYSKKHYTYNVWHPYLLDSIRVLLNIDSSFEIISCDQHMIEENSKCVLFQSTKSKVVLNHFVLPDKVPIKKSVQNESREMLIQIKDANPNMVINPPEFMHSSNFEGVAVRYHDSELNALDFRGVNNEFQSSIGIYIETSDPELELKTQLIQILNSMHIWRGK